MAKTIGSQDVARKKNKMPAFLAKAKKNPKSTNPGKNTKSYSKVKARAARTRPASRTRSRMTLRSSARQTGRTTRFRSW